MRRVAAVGVDDDLAAGEPGVGLRAADLEAAGGVHEDAHAARVELGELAQHRVDHLGLDVGREQRLDVDLLAVLRADQHGVDARPASRPRTRSRPGSCRRAAGTGTTPALRTSARRLASRCAIAIGSGISSSVSRHAKPNIMPWSPAPSVSRSSAEWPSRCSSASSTPRAMSGDCSWIAVMTPHVSPSRPNLASV